jgi:large subunit ribosomal protein L35
MPKMKIKGAVKKRLKVTGSGRIKRRKANLRHLLTHKSSDRKRKLGQMAEISATDLPRVKRMLEGH